MSLLRKLHKDIIPSSSPSHFRGRHRESARSAYASAEFQLSCLLFLGFFEYGRDKIAASEDSFVIFGLLPFSLRCLDLGPASKAADKPSADQLGLAAHADPLVHESSVCVPRSSCCVVELDQYIIRVHPGAFSFVHHGAVAAPGIAVKLFYGLYHFGPHGIEMDVPD